MATTTENPAQKKRIFTHYLDLSRSVAANHFRTEKTKEPVIDASFKLKDFLTRKILSWFYYYVKGRFGKSHKYLSWQFPDTGIYKLIRAANSSVDSVSVAVVADWATDTQQSDTIAWRMAGHDPDYTIHLGDTYFVGEPKEMRKNFINDDSSWVRGSVGSFALPGNHEMYAKGDAYFEELLPSLGLRNSMGQFDGQKAAFFCLENDHWRILGLDTGYHSIGKIPLIEMLPWCGPDCHFNDALIQWLRDTVKLGDVNDKRGILVLTHHQYISAFKNESEYIKPASQLAELIGKERKILWLWGHEHKLSIFEKAQVKDGVTAYGRCIGHGGMPIELDKFKKSSKENGFEKLVMVDERANPEATDFHLGFNGYALVKIKDAELSIEYHDINKKLFTEKWNVDANGIISGNISIELDCDLKHVEGKTWDDAVKP